VAPGLENVGDLALVHEHRGLAGAHYELRAVLDLVVVAVEPVHQRVAGLVQPLDDVDQLGLDEFPETHGG